MDGQFFSEGGGGVEIAKLELNGPIRKGGKYRTGIKRTKNAGVEICRNGITKPACAYETSSERNRR